MHINNCKSKDLKGTLLLLLILLLFLIAFLYVLSYGNKKADGIPARMAYINGKIYIVSKKLDSEKQTIQATGKIEFICNNINDYPNRENEANYPNMIDDEYTIVGNEVFIKDYGVWCRTKEIKNLNKEDD